MKQTFSLPMPPSVNEMFRNLRNGGRAKTSIYKDWRGHAGWVLKSQHPERVDSHVVFVVSVERGTLHADIDNRIKAMFDLFVGAGVIVDDSRVVAFAAAWNPPANKIARVMLIPAAEANGMTLKFHLSEDGAHGGWFIAGADEDDLNDFSDFDEEDGSGPATEGACLRDTGHRQDDACR
jgi:Holliday junction resolvase RusA-like endonuclease